MIRNFNNGGFRFPNPVINTDDETYYATLYNEEGTEFIHILEDSPYEIAVISKMIAFLHAKRKDLGDFYGHN